MRVLGIDCGSERTGYGVVDSDGLSYAVVESGVIRCRTALPLAEKLLQIADGLRSLIHTHNPEVVAIEDVFYAVNAKSALKLGHVRGVAMLEAARCRLPVSEYSPLQVKLSVVGYGRAEKFQVQQMVKALLRLKEAPPEDAADALAVAICHINISATEQKLKRGAAH